MNGDFQLAVLDASGTAAAHRVPVGLSAFAACTGVTVHRRPGTIPAGTPAVLLLLDRKLGRCRDTLLALRRVGKTVVVTFAESGGMPIADLVDTPESVRQFFEICGSADAAVATTPDSAEVLRGAGVRHVEFIPAPCPVDDPRWDFSVRSGQRRGIFVGTSDFSSYYYNHSAALLSLRDLAARLSEPVTVMRSGRLFDRRMMRQVRRHWPAGLLKVISGPPPADRLVRLMATHKLVFQLEWAGGVGQVAAEALLCRIPCVGGHGVTERTAFPELSGFGRTTDELVDMAARLLRDPHAADTAVARASALAAEQLSPVVARARLARLVDRATIRARAAGPKVA